MDEELMKKCSRCKELKPLSNFYNDVSRKDGKDHMCIGCRKAIINKVRVANIQRRYEERNPERQAARLLIRRLIAQGKITKENCFLCNSPESVAHHLQYDFPDKVIWLCPKHHNEVHHEL